MLGGLEFAYVLNCLGLTPRRVLYEVHLQQVTAALAELEGVKEPSSWGQGDEYYDGEPSVVRARGDEREADRCLLLQTCAWCTSSRASSCA